MTRKKPWNRVNLPVYSVASKAGNKFNLHICTYATAISMHPKRFMVCIYKGTQTLENILHNPEFVLQVMDTSQYKLVNLLGKKTGRKTEKVRLLEKRKELMEWKGFKILAHCLAVLLLQVMHKFDEGDHICFVCEVKAWKNLNEGTALNLDKLRKHKIISI